MEYLIVIIAVGAILIWFARSRRKQDVQDFDTWFYNDTMRNPHGSLEDALQRYIKQFNISIRHELDEPEEITYARTKLKILESSIFGDHCSPISDTTVLSSISAGCDHIDHVSTQMAYALTTMVMAATGGYLAVAWGMPAWIYFLLFPACALGLLLTIGKKVPPPKLGKT